jgi:hypothetical protein
MVLALKTDYVCRWVQCAVRAEKRQIGVAKERAEQ